MVKCCLDLIQYAIMVITFVFVMKSVDHKLRLNHAKLGKQELPHALTCPTRTEITFVPEIVPY